LEFTQKLKVAVANRFAATREELKPYQASILNKSTAWGEHKAEFAALTRELALQPGRITTHTVSLFFH
jgi:hypothetical protein